MGPIPTGVDKLVASNLEAADALLFQLLINLGLGSDAGMVGAQDPTRGLAAHASHADDGILDGVIGSVAHMQLTGNVGRRNGDGAVAHTGTTAIVAAIKPLLKDCGLVDRRIICLGHLFCHIHAPQESKFA